jgi:large subunit ribosomal protein L18
VVFKSKYSWKLYKKEKTMIKLIDKNEIRKEKHIRLRNKDGRGLYGTAKQPRLNVFRSLNHIQAQIIDDERGHTLVAAATTEKKLAALLKGKTKSEKSAIIGEELAKRAKAKKIGAVVFDRGGYLYTGRVAALADGARKGGLKF